MGVRVRASLQGVGMHVGVHVGMDIEARVKLNVNVKNNVGNTQNEFIFFVQANGGLSLNTSFVSYHICEAGQRESGIALQI